MAVPEIFDRHARVLRRNRIGGKEEGFFAGLIIDELLDRLRSVTRRFDKALLIGAEPRLLNALEATGLTVTVLDPSAARASSLGGTASQEDRLTGVNGQFDLVVAAGTLDTVADLPGALLLIRRALRPDGLMLAGMAGAPSFPSLRRAIAIVDQAIGLPVARMHPQIDVRAAGDLLMRAGFALPVADLNSFDLSYPDLGRLIADLRGSAMTNVLQSRYPVTRAWRAVAAAAFAAQSDTDGRVHETISLITLTGWAPSPDQPQPAARGSGASLATVLRPRDQGSD